MAAMLGSSKRIYLLLRPNECFD
jgi:hypothetical protein